MRIYIITMEDPLFTIDFIKKIIDHRYKDIVGIAITKADRLTIGKKKSKIIYLLSLLMIMGLPGYIGNISKTILYKLRKRIVSCLPFLKNPSLEYYAKSKGIPVSHINTPNNKEFLQELKKLNIDLIINQSQNILKKPLLEIPKIGVINRHNALLPKNRGRLTPFWVLYKGENETGVSIHFVEEGIDSGAIIVQEKFQVAKNETFNSLVKKNYSCAIGAMLKAIDLLETGNYTLMPNPDSEATYNTIPGFREAFRYRFRRKNTAH